MYFSKAALLLIGLFVGSATATGTTVRRHDSPPSAVQDVAEPNVGNKSAFSIRSVVSAKPPPLRAPKKEYSKGAPHLQPLPSDSTLLGGTNLGGQADEDESRILQQGRPKLPKPQTITGRNCPSRRCRSTIDKGKKARRECYLKRCCRPDCKGRDDKRQCLIRCLKQRIQVTQNAWRWADRKCPKDFTQERSLRTRCPMDPKNPKNNNNKKKKKKKRVLEEVGPEDDDKPETTGQRALGMYAEKVKCKQKCRPVTGKKRSPQCLAVCIQRAGCKSKCKKWLGQKSKQCLAVCMREKPTDPPEPPLPFPPKAVITRSCGKCPICGDGKVNQEFEECDEGKNNGKGKCSSDCQCVGDCKRCGDGIINQDWEECDDGNNVDGDGCSASCQIEKTDPPTSPCTEFPTTLDPEPEFAKVCERRFDFYEGDFVHSIDVTIQFQQHFRGDARLDAQVTFKFPQPKEEEEPLPDFFAGIVGVAFSLYEVRSFSGGKDHPFKIIPDTGSVVAVNEVCSPSAGPECKENPGFTVDQGPYPYDAAIKFDEEPPMAKFVIAGREVGDPHSKCGSSHVDITRFAFENSDWYVLVRTALGGVRKVEGKIDSLQNCLNHGPDDEVEG